jgi:hypothetical protein
MKDSDRSIPDTNPSDTDFSPVSAEAILDLANYEEPIQPVDTSAAGHKQHLAKLQKQWATDDRMEKKRRTKLVVGLPGYVKIDIREEELEWFLAQALDTVLPYKRIAELGKVKFGRYDEWVAKLYKFSDKQRMKAILKKLGKTNNTGKILVECGYMNGAERLSTASTGALRNVMNNIQYEKKREYRIRTLEENDRLRQNDIARLEARLEALEHNNPGLSTWLTQAQAMKKANPKLTYKDIGAAFDMTESATQKAFSRAKKVLLQLVEPESDT